MEQRDIFSEIHGDNPREGPGDSISTQRALSMLSDLPPKPHILDVGNGPGMQTIEIAQRVNGDITALDCNPEYLAEVEKRAGQSGVAQKIKTVEGSMFSMPFQDKSFDAIWSEGAIYIIGFREGLDQWKRFLKDNGYLAVTHLSWLKPDPPKEARAFWQEAYPKGINETEENLRIATYSGYQEVGHFTLPESAWWVDYYTPLEQKLLLLREKYKDDPSALKRIGGMQRKIDLYREYSDHYGYVFYVLRKNS
jgi:SAM-dependent methyltransferase